MKARITQMKAPWPSGAVVGSIVLFAAGAIPAWAAGKCEPVGVDETPTHVVPAGGEQAKGGDADADQVREEARQHIARLEAEFAAHAQDLQAKLTAKSEEAEKALSGKAEAEARVAELEGKLAAAEEGKAAAVKAADDLQAKLTAATAPKRKG